MAICDAVTIVSAQIGESHGRYCLAWGGINAIDNFKNLLFIGHV